jgi:tetratricopeptide (TPR) repeat protein
MKWITWNLCLGLALVGSFSGCLTPSAVNATFKPETPIGNGSIGKDNNLPDKETAKLQLNIAQELEKNGYFVDAADRYEKARQLDPKITNLSRRLALLYDKTGNERKALDEYEEALKLAPNDPNLLNDLGYCHYNRGRWTEAETCFRRALAADPKHKRANINLGLALAQQDKLDEAMESFLKVTRPAEAKANVAFVLAARGKKAEAKAMYQESLRLEPGLLTAQNGLAALEAPKKPDVLDTPVRTAGCDSACCVNGECSTPKVRLPDMSPITIDPQTARSKRTEE